MKAGNCESFLSCSEATQHIHRLWITKAGNTQPPTHLLLKQPKLYISCSEATQHIHRFLDYEGRKHTAPHTFTAEAASPVHFFQRGYSAHPQIVDYQGRNTQPPTHLLLKRPKLYISCSEATQHIHRFWIMKAGNTQPPTHILLQQPLLCISCSEATQHIHRLWISKAGNTQPPTHLLLKQPTLYISCSEATQHIHRFWISKAGNTQPPTHLLLKQPTLYISSSEATQHIHRLWIIEGRKHTAPPHIYCYSSLRCTFLPARLLSTSTDCGLRRQETHSHPHIYC